MRYRRVLIAAVLAFGIITLIPVPQLAQASKYERSSSSLAKVSSTRFSECAALLKQFPKGVARNQKAAGSSGAKVNAKIYDANRGLDRDKDGAACETDERSKTFTFSGVGVSSYSPTSYTIRVGDKVNWPASHPASFSGAAGVTSRTFTSVGVFSFVCAIHGAQMSGSVTVQK